MKDKKGLRPEYIIISLTVFSMAICPIVNCTVDHLLNMLFSLYDLQQIQLSKNIYFLPTAGAGNSIMVFPYRGYKLGFSEFMDTTMFFSLLGLTSLFFQSILTLLASTTVLYLCCSVRPLRRPNLTHSRSCNLWTFIDNKEPHLRSN